ncbi:MAG: LamG domain-containing protein [Planctomycetota bacterium]
MTRYQRPIAHWTLDEQEGNIAQDKVGENDASVYGDALWFPTEGMFGGALLLDGTDDWVFTDLARQPSSGTFSIVAWVKGWAPGRVLISQASASNWLMADAAGNLISQIKCIGRADGPPVSETIVTDGNWHRIALIWNGSKRMLYVDGVSVAEDSRTGLNVSNTGLNFGVGSHYASGTYWSGMIDDVRIYDVALSTEQIGALAQ